MEISEINNVVPLTPEGVLAVQVDKVPHSSWEVSEIKYVLLTHAGVLAGRRWEVSNKNKVVLRTPARDFIGLVE